MIEQIARAIIMGSAGERAANHAQEFVTANWEDAKRSAQAILPLIEAAVLTERERCAGVAEQQAQEFLSPQYAVGQPLSSFNERFACSEVAKAIRSQPCYTN